MLSIRHIVLIALLLFLPIFALIWFSAPWSTSRASFEVRDMGVLNGRLPDVMADTGTPTSQLMDHSYLSPDVAAKAVHESYTRRHAAVFKDLGVTWDVKLRERMRSLVCRDQLEPWRYRGKTACSWLNDLLEPNLGIDQLDVVEERLSIIRTDGDRRIDVAFRAADPHLAEALVEAYGEGLLEHYAKASIDLKRRVIDAIEAEFNAMAEGVSDRNESVQAGVGIGRGSVAPDLDLLARFSDALRRARDELPSDERQRLAGEINAIDDVARNELLGRMAGQMSEAEQIGAARAQGNRSETASSLLSLLSHPEWSKPPITQLSATTTDTLSTPTMVVLALFLALAAGALSSLFWSTIERRSQRQDNFYASPYANPHWPNMRVANEAD